MTKPWISRPRWTCKYCNVTINDDVPSRAQHENGLRHKGNVERSLREAYKKSERERAQLRSAKHEMEKIERLARQQHAEQDAPAASPVRSGGEASSSTSPPSLPAASASKASASSSSSRPTPQWKPTDKLSAYGSALPTYAEEQAKLEEVRQQAWQDQQEERRKQGTAGEWETVTPIQQPLSVSHPDSTTRRIDTTEHFSTASSLQTREKQGYYRDDEDDEDGVPAIKVKKRMRTANEAERERQQAERQRTMLPTWKPMRFDTGVSAKQEGVQLVPVQKISNEANASLVEEGDDNDQKPLDTHTATPTGMSIDDTQTASSASSASTSMFKKRKTGAGTGAKKVRAVI